MSLSDFFASLRRYDANAAVIFDPEEPVGQATDLVMPRRHLLEGPASRCRAALWRRRPTGKGAASRLPITAPNDR